MKIEINEQKILTEVLERDSSIHEKIKNVIEQRIINDVVDAIESEYLKDNWRGVINEINNRVLEDLEKKQKEFVIKILKEFYESYRYKKADLQILKKLKEFIGEHGEEVK